MTAVSVRAFRLENAIDLGGDAQFFIRSCGLFSGTDAPDNYCHEEEREES